MKIRNSIYSILFFAACSSSFLFLSCSGENEGASIDSTTTLNVHKTNNLLPFNGDNVYDYAGIIHNEILSVYYQSRHLPTRTEAILARVDSIALHNRAFSSIAPTDYQVPEPGRIDYILSHKITSATAIITGTTISVTAKSSLSNFASAMFAFSTTDDDYATVYSFITEYESAVMKNILLTNRDKEVILTVSSIARHSLYAKKKRPKKNTDPDWDVLVSNIIASIDGSSDGQAEAIVCGLAAGIAENPR